jgi:hypothetical protein
MFHILFVTNEEIAEIILDFYVMEKYFCVFMRDYRCKRNPI